MRSGDQSDWLATPSFARTPPCAPGQTRHSRCVAPQQDSFDLTPDEVRRRFEWALRQGDPAWLWPEVTVEEWREACDRIADAANAVLTGEEAVLDANPLALGIAAYTSGTGPLLGWWIEQGQLRARSEIAALLRTHLAHNRIRSERMIAATRTIVGSLAVGGIEVAVLKGMHTGAVYFPDPATRPASDIDLLVSPADSANAEEALRANGFAIAGRGSGDSSWRPAGGPVEPRSLSLVHSDDPWSVDLHWSLDVQPSAGARVAKFDRAAPLESKACWPANERARVLEQPLLTLYLAAHASEGLQNLTLVRLVELVLVIRSDVERGSLDWDALLDTGARIDALGLAWPALALTEQLVPGTVPGAVLQRLEASSPPAVRRVVSALTPTTAQRIGGFSIAEHFMWSRGITGRLQQFAADAVPSVSPFEFARIYGRRIRQLLSGRVSR